MTPPPPPPPSLPLPLAIAVRCLPREVRREVAGELLAHYRRLRERAGRSGAERWAWRQPLVALSARFRWDRPVTSPGTGGSVVSGILDDIRVAVRSVRRRVGLAAAVVTTIAVSVGAIGAIASVIDAVLLRPLPYPEPDRLVWVNGYERSAARDLLGPPLVGFANPLDVADWTTRARYFDAVTAIEGFDGTIEAGDEPVRVNVGKLNADVGRVLGIRAAHGRLFVQDDYGNGVRVMVITSPLWRSRFGADPDLVGRSVPLDGVPYTVIGVLPETTVPFPDGDVDVWLPMAPPVATGDSRQRGGVWQGVLARLTPGTALEVAQADMTRVAAELAAEYPTTNAKRGIALVPFRDGLVGPTRTVLWMLSTAIVVVLAIACANVGHLLLVNVQGRRREFAVRAALGASGWRVARLVLIESAALAVAGGVAGVFFAPWLLRAFLAAYPADLPAVGAVVVSPLALGAAALATFVATLASAVPPLLGARSHNLGGSMRATDRGSDSRGQRRVRAALVLAQVALSTALLVGGGLLLRTFWEVRATPLGFAPENVLTFNVALSDTHYPSRAAEAAFYRDLFERIGALPGVTAAGATTLLPLTPGDFIDGFARVGANDTFPGLPSARLQNITPGYLEAMGLGLVAGRTVEAADTEGSPQIAVVNETLQRLYFPEGAVGRQIQFRGTRHEIVGVVGDKRHRSLREETRADLYIPRAQADWPRWFGWVAVRHSGATEGLVPAIRAAVRDVDSRVAVDGIGTMADRVDRTLAPDRFRAVLVGALAAVALLLVVVGLYGLVAYAVARDARDTAIRMALGASSGRTVGAVLRRVLWLTTGGIVCGIGLAMTGQQLLASFVAGVTVRDPLTMAVVGVGLLVVALFAAAGPAIRASRVDPALVLRGQ